VAAGDVAGDGELRARERRLRVRHVVHAQERAAELAVRSIERAVAVEQHVGLVAAQEHLDRLSAQPVLTDDLGRVGVREIHDLQPAVGAERVEQVALCVDAVDVGLLDGATDVVAVLRLGGEQPVDGSPAAGEEGEELGLAQPAVGQELAILIREGLVLLGDGGGLRRRCG
jgi:hypothetical protein